MAQSDNTHIVFVGEEDAETDKMVQTMVAELSSIEMAPKDKAIQIAFDLMQLLKRAMAHVDGKPRFMTSDLFRIYAELQQVLTAYLAEKVPLEKAALRVVLAVQTVQMVMTGGWTPAYEKLLGRHVLEHYRSLAGRDIAAQTGKLFRLLGCTVKMSKGKLCVTKLGPRDRMAEVLQKHPKLFHVMPACVCEAAGMTGPSL